MERLPIAEAANRLGVSDVTIRRRIKRGDLQAEKEPTAQGYEWRVLVPITLEPPPRPEHETGDVPPTVGTSAGTGEADALRGTIAVLERELATRNAEVDRLLQLLSREQEIARAAQLALPARVGDCVADDQAGTTQRPADQGRWPRLLSRLVDGWSPRSSA